MKKIITCICVMTLALTSCNTTTTDNKKSFTENTLFSIIPTTDPAYCNLDSVVPTDCGLGDLFLSKTGDVIYSPFCMGMDSFTYYIGKYNITDTAINCEIQSEYSYALCQDCETSVENPNAGILKEIKKWNLILKKTKCNDVPYFIANSQDEYRQGLKLETDIDSYCKQISQIKALNQFHCAYNTQKKETTVYNKVDDEILNKIILYYGKQNLKSIPKREETDSLISLSFTENSKDELATPYSNISIPKMKSEYLFGDLNNDGKEDIIASIYADSGGSATWLEYVTLISEDNQYVLKSVASSFDLAICNGGSHDGQFYPKEIKGGIIYGTSVCYTDEDAHCCPSIKKENNVVYKKDKLVKTN